MTGKYLITTDAWFVGNDGINYKAAWGKVEIMEDTFLGLKTNRNSTNWYIKVGSEEKHIIIAGCQIHYAVKCDNKPNTDPSEDWTADSSKLHIYKRPCQIYIAE